MKRESLSWRMVHEGSLILVNRDHPLRGAVCESRLASIGGCPEVRLKKKAASALQALLGDIHCKGQIVFVSGYRTGREQAQIYQGSLRDNGAEFTQKYVMPPDCSEHQTGLAIDLALNRPDIDFIRPCFPDTGICAAFRDRAAAFGFIARYPKGKESITGIAHEPWHFRYVGTPHSMLIEAMGVTLEEYLVWLRGFPCGDAPFRHSFDGTAFEMIYIAAGEENHFEMDDGSPCSVSGDNTGGFIVTRWREKK